MSNCRYSTSFTTGSLFHQESVKLVNLYIALGSWTFVRSKVIEENLLQARTVNTLKRVCREIISRLKTLSWDELELLSQGNLQEQAYLLWLAVCRRYKFIADFAIEVIREHYIMLKTDITYDDFDAFFNRKSEWNLELEKISPLTRSKLRQVLFKMLREVNLLTNDNKINAAMLSSTLLNVINRGRLEDVLYFPIFDSDVKRVKQ